MELQVWCYFSRFNGDGTSNFIPNHKAINNNERRLCRTKIFDNSDDGRLKKVFV
jgi:hypothetical protein